MTFVGSDKVDTPETSPSSPPPQPTEVLEGIDTLTAQIVSQCRAFETLRTSVVAVARNISEDRIRSSSSNLSFVRRGAIENRARYIGASLSKAYRSTPEMEEEGKTTTGRDKPRTRRMSKRKKDALDGELT